MEETIQKEDIRKDFPFFKGLCVYLDSAATTQKPKCVIDTLENFYSHQYGTVHRAIYDLSLQATDLYEQTRQKVAQLLNAELNEIIFCRGTTDGINLIAQSFSRAFLKPQDTILITEMEHHSNIVPWQLIAKEKDLKLKWIPLKKDGSLDLSSPSIFEGVKLLAVTHISNVTGIENPIKHLIKLAHEKGAKVLIDGAQAVAHKKVDVKDLDCDFYLFSGHKMYGPTGVGVIYGKRELLEMMPPIQGGGDMIEEVFMDHSTYQAPPIRFEAGTPMIAQVIGLGAAIDYLLSVGLENIQEHEETLFGYLFDKISTIKGLKRFPKDSLLKGAIFSFDIEGIHPLDIATFLNLSKIAIRSGHLCCQPFLRRFGKESLCRLSLGIYNTKEDIDFFVENLASAVASLS